VIVVAGEALVDLIAAGDGRLLPRAGGGAFNVARAISRLGQPCSFLGSLSGDNYGRLLASLLTADGVTVLRPDPVPAPTTLAVAELGPDGSARYEFYLAGTSASGLDYSEAAAALPAGLTAVHAGTLSLLMEPVATTIERLITTDLPPSVLVMLDPNCRPGAVTDEPAYRARLARLLRRADIVKVSEEDLSYLRPGLPPATAAVSLLHEGPAVVLLTEGPRPARAFLPGQEVSVAVPAVTVADTIGAGDAFGGAFLAWWTATGRTRSELGDAVSVRAGLERAARVAALSCTRSGAEPPRAAEVAGWPASR
jgi:fructokinase